MVNPDCALKTRRWKEILPALSHLVQAAGGAAARTPVDDTLTRDRRRHRRAAPEPQTSVEPIATAPSVTIAIDTRRTVALRRRVRSRAADSAAASASGCARMR